MHKYRSSKTFDFLATPCTRTWMIYRKDLSLSVVSNNYAQKGHFWDLHRPIHRVECFGRHIHINPCVPSSEVLTFKGTISTYILIRCAFTELTVRDSQYSVPRTKFFIGVAFLFQIFETASRLVNSHEDGTFLVLSFQLEVQSGCPC